ncbi:MAG: hypothetical protein US50_C0001G0014 [Candidatus Nomurabacteria bacterium GW2011_GWB1_37_5]|uniref:Peptidase M48 domain-containing protein n=1 Tax=Candidatus Nomurabacteria bacterium GW2011_GWB1_37_5 TaxID=1618742 RepID=A0A0G0H1F3_9BACT|nr:MAG: hypothetical protein US50_C0001G0014 [Candidatus Nomurabacteria bacterium GW2011_GWB1_37_5]
MKTKLLLGIATILLIITAVTALAQDENALLKARLLTVYQINISENNAVNVAVYGDLEKKFEKAIKEACMKLEAKEMGSLPYFIIMDDSLFFSGKIIKENDGEVVGLSNPKTGIIFLKSTRTEKEIMRTLWHEIAHLRLKALRKEWSDFDSLWQNVSTFKGNGLKVTTGGGNAYNTALAHVDTLSGKQICYAECTDIEEDIASFVAEIYAALAGMPNLFEKVKPDPRFSKKLNLLRAGKFINESQFRQIKTKLNW